jgi:hypothetical protein
MTELSLADVPQSIREVVEAAEAAGNRVATVAPWTKMPVVHMREPLTGPQRAALKAGFPHLGYARSDPTPHNPAAEHFIDDAARAAVSFPVGHSFVR